MFKFNVLLDKLNIKYIFFNINCDSYTLNKTSKLPFMSSINIVDAPFHLIHADL